ncbi:MAG: hypothetical protein CBC13_07425 [Planctomycetia bacterium TMED53]|nr:MAG: hypothetical protein CBC13_07425 [Planctomycetia bacterium TMED53]
MARIALIGLPGSGKSTLGSSLGAALDSPFLDMDSLLEESSGKSPRQWVESYGWEVFRSAESIILAALDRSYVEDSDVVIGCGGGVVETAANVEILKKWNCIWLDAEDEVLLRRTRGSDRPQHFEASEEVVLSTLRIRRSSIYCSLGGTAVDTTPMNPDDVLDSVLKQLGER